VDFSWSREEKVARLILAWYAPEWEGMAIPPPEACHCDHGSLFAGESQKPLPGGCSLLPRREAFSITCTPLGSPMGGSGCILARNHKSLLDRIIAWQSVSMTDQQLPGWLQTR